MFPGILEERFIFPQALLSGGFLSFQEDIQPQGTVSGSPTVVSKQGYFFSYWCPQFPTLYTFSGALF